MEREIRRKIPVYGAAAILVALLFGMICYNVGVQFFGGPFSVFETFGSEEELKTHLEKRLTNYQSDWWLSPFTPNVPRGSWALAVEDSSFSYALDYSSTNLQVAGVDEADFVKSDGEYLYVVSGSNVYILKAYPPEEAELIKVLGFNQTPQELYVAGDKLCVLGCVTSYHYEYYDSQLASYYYWHEEETYVKVFDISDRAHPVSTRNFTISGRYLNTRRIGDYLYLVVTQPAEILNETVVLPTIRDGNRTIEVSAEEIQYVNVLDYFYMYTTITAINLQDDAQEPTYTPLLLGGASCIYVSLWNIYVTVPKGGNTVIYRIHVENDVVTPSAKGEVPGSVLNQFSMDEYDGHFRIATTVGHISRTFDQATSENNVYVLNMNLTVVGQLENLAPGERIYSARFIDGRCYLVTFKKIDPLFVIDLSEPTAPTVLGELKIPGYSDYLHPYDETHIIGVGKETVEAVEGDFAWFQGVKISLFDVSNVSDPQQIDKFIIGDRGSDSQVLRDHKAFLFDASKSLLVIPVKVAEINETMYPEGVPGWAYGETVWQGAYVFNVTLSSGFNLKGGVTHIEEGMDVTNRGYWVNRALYIEDVLYTVSNRKVALNSLESLEPIIQVELP